MRCRLLDSRFAVPCPSDRNALRNPQRQLASDRWHQFEKTKMTRSFQPNSSILSTLLVTLFLTCLTSCNKEQSIQGTWTRVYKENLTDYDTLTELWTFNENTVYSRLLIDNDSIAFENESKYSIDSDKGLLTIHIIDKERGIDTVTKSSIKTLTENELELVSERNQLLKFERKK